MPLRSANIIGSGPNGLSAAITLAQRGVAVTVYERNATPGGACSTAETTLPGFHHALGAFAYPLIGFRALLPFALLLAAIAVLPIAADLRHPRAVTSL